MDQNGGRMSRAAHAQRCPRPRAGNACMGMVYCLEEEDDGDGLTLKCWHTSWRVLLSMHSSFLAAAELCCIDRLMTNRVLALNSHQASHLAFFINHDIVENEMQ